jgi:hypothetical protein
LAPWGYSGQGAGHRRHRRLLISCLGGSRYQIGGPAAAFIVIIAKGLLDSAAPVVKAVK